MRRRPLKRIRSTLFGIGFSGCKRCGLKWNAVEHHTTEYTYSSGCFPLCVDCWDDLGTPEARLPYYLSLVRQWQSSGRSDHNGIPWPTLRELVTDAVMTEAA